MSFLRQPSLIRPFRSSVFLVVALLLGCAAPAQPGRETTAGAPEGLRAAGPKRIVVGIRGNPATPVMKVTLAGGTGQAPGAEELEELVNTRLGMVDPQGNVRPYLAASVPRVEDGSWVVLSGGGMETRWTIRPNARWHDGRPFTAEDVVFSYTVWSDQEIGIFRDPRYLTVDTVEAPDPLTLVVRWRQPYIYADRIFDVALMPRHILEPIYREAKTTLPVAPYWTQEYVGTGAFKVREWAVGSHAVLEAFDDFVLGRPRLDEIVFRYILDTNTMMANVLAGEIEVSMGAGLSHDQGNELKEKWAAGKVESDAAAWMAAFPKLLDPRPDVIRDVRFRRALLMAIDRQTLADTLLPGMSGVAHSFVGPDQPWHNELQPSVVKYDYDPRQSRQLIEGLGYTMGGDGFFRDAAGQRLTIEARTNEGWDFHFKTLYPTVDYWQRAGVGVDIRVLNRAEAQDRTTRATFPGFEVIRNPTHAERLLIFHSSQMRTPENNYVGSNYMNYNNPEWDALLDRFFSTIPLRERTQVLGQILHMMTDQLLVMGIIYEADPYLIANRIVNMNPPRGNVRSPHAWNGHEWDIR
jgi:peptide/nickel transport system substrate-binding protein